MNLSMSITCAPMQKTILGLRLAGGATRSIFPAIEKAISKSTNAQRALIRVKGGPELDDFNCFMDYLVSAVFPEIKRLCFLFYWDPMGRPLRDQITEQGRDGLEILLLGALEAALVAFDHQHIMHWDEVRRLLATLDVPKIRLYPKGATPLQELADAAV